jgi:hypothetical protein
VTASYPHHQHIWLKTVNTKSFKWVRFFDAAKIFNDVCLIIWNVSLADLPNYWQNLTFVRCSNCDILDFRRSQTTKFHNSDFLSECTPRTQLLLAGATAERTRHYHVAPRIHCSAQQRHYAANPRNYWLYYVKHLWGYVTPWVGNLMEKKSLYVQRDLW